MLLLLFSVVTLGWLLTLQSACFGFSNPKGYQEDSIQPRQRNGVKRDVTSPTFCVYSEIGGAGLSLWSVHGELTVFSFNHDTDGLGIHHSLRLSAGYSVNGNFLPVAAKYILLESNHHIETGFGVTFSMKARGGHDALPESSAVGVFIFGYRYEPQDGGLVIRANLSPWIDLSTGSGNFFFGFSIGLAM